MTTAALLTMWELVGVGQRVPSITQQGQCNVSDVLSTNAMSVTTRLSERAVREMLRQFSGNWRTRTAAALVIVSIALGAAGNIIGALR